MICGMIAMLSVSSLARAKDIQSNIFVFPSLAIFERFRNPIAKDFSQADRSSLPSQFRRANLLVVALADHSPRAQMAFSSQPEHPI